MTDAELSALESAARAATPGPWKAVGQCVADSDRYVLANCNTNFSKGQVVSNAAYIAAANPASILELIAELRQARAERDALINYIVEHGGYHLSIWEKCPYKQDETHRCNDCWLKATKEAVCQTQNSERK